MLMAQTDLSQSLVRPTVFSTLKELKGRNFISFCMVMSPLEANPIVKSHRVWGKSLFPAQKHNSVFRSLNLRLLPWPPPEKCIRNNFEENNQPEIHSPFILFHYPTPSPVAFNPVWHFKRSWVCFALFYTLKSLLTRTLRAQSRLPGGRTWISKPYHPMGSCRLWMSSPMTPWAGSPQLQEDGAGIRRQAEPPANTTLR